MAILPSSLVVVRRLPNMSAGSRGWAAVYAEERKLLADAGIASYVKLDGIGSIVLVVPEEQAAAARRLLPDSPDLFKHRLPPPCPRCHTFHPAVRPPYELAPIGLSVLIGGGLAVAGFMAAAYMAVPLCVVSAAIMHSHMAPWRCQACGFSFGSSRDRHHPDN
jgi:hypothetical protein